MEVLEVGELWVGLDKESFMQSFRKRDVGWQRLGVLQLGPGHICEKDRGTWKIVMDGFGNRSFGTGEGESWGKGWRGTAMGTKGNGFVKRL